MTGIYGAALAGGLVGTVIMTVIFRAASELGLTRMDLPFLLGTAFTEHRGRAKVYGHLTHFVLGVLFAMGYAMVFRLTGHSGWEPGLLLGVAHAAFIATTLVNVLLPVVHGRIGTPETAAADTVALLESPGFMMLNYGRNTFLVTLTAHMAYGALVGWACANMTG
jgi:hypothetical protein